MNRVKHFILVPLMAAIAAAAGTPLTTELAAQTGAGFVVIVNEDNAITELGKEELSKIFLKRQVRWADGPAIVPVDQSGKTETRQRFSEAVHGRPAAAVRAYWQQQIFSGRNVPPVEKSGDEEVIRHVAESIGGIGYVREGVALPPGVRVIAVPGVKAANP